MKLSACVFCPDNYESGTFASHICEAMHERLCFACMACSDARGTRIYVFADVNLHIAGFLCIGTVEKNHINAVQFTCVQRDLIRMQDILNHLKDFHNGSVTPRDCSLPEKVHSMECKICRQQFLGQPPSAIFKHLR